MHGRLGVPAVRADERVAASRHRAHLPQGVLPVQDHVELGAGRLPGNPDRPGAGVLAFAELSEVLQSRLPYDGRAVRQADGPTGRSISDARPLRPTESRAAATSAKSSSGASMSRRPVYFHVSRNCVEKWPARTSGSARSPGKNGMEFSIPSPRDSSRAEITRAMAFSRSSPHVISLATSGS